MNDRRLSVTVGIINYRDYRDLPRCLGAVAGQTRPPEAVVLFDNSDDAEARSALRRAWPSVSVVHKGVNRGYAGAANDILRSARTSTVLLMNPDVFLKPDFLERLLAAVEADPSVAIAGGKLLREEGALDSAGIEMRRTRRALDRGQGEADRGQYPSGPVFGVCGAALLIRRSFAESIAVDGEVFDEDFFCYHEDTDVCWRARLLGGNVAYCAEATAIHRRGWGGKDPRSGVPEHLRLRSFRNHYFRMIKNETAGTFFPHLPWILLHEVLRLSYAACREPFLLKGYGDVLRLFARMWRKRRDVMRRRPVPRADLAALFLPSF